LRLQSQLEADQTEKDECDYDYKDYNNII